MLKQKGLWLCLGLYLALAVITLALWQHKGLNQVTGDEPHYLVIADGIARDGSFDVSQAYAREFAERRIFPAGLAPADAVPGPSNSHGLPGPNGLFSGHNVGLPLLLALPLKLGGMLGSKLFMILLSSWGVVLAWKLSRHYGASTKLAMLAVVALTTALPMLPAANQIYPDLLAGLICLSGLYWLATPQYQRRTLTVLGYALAVAFLPWLQIKFSAAGLVLVLAATWLSIQQRRDAIRTLLWPVAFGLSILLLASYNLYAYGKMSGPYQSDALEISANALMVLVGLLVDQNQGMLLQNPMLMLGALFLVPLARREPMLMGTWLLVFLALLVPNAMHPNWYGGGSFSGRFGWSAALCLFLPTLAALPPLKERIGKRPLVILLIAFIFLQAYAWRCYAWSGVSLYQRPTETWLSAYSVFYGRLTTWLPALYDIQWAPTYAPNYLFALLLPLLMGYGWYLFRGKPATGVLRPRYVLASIVVLVALTGSFSRYQEPPLHFPAAVLPALTGQLDGWGRLALPQRDAPGFVSFGPYVTLPQGRYRLSINYQGSAPSSESVATWDVYRPRSSDPVLMAVSLPGTSGAVAHQEIEFRVKRSRPEPYEFRVSWPGNAELRVMSLAIERLH
ncbi:hypothetical protein [Pseudomonas nitroreducens]|uniref:hypothetical protein n=1 Tax=Pseudomonas nitroreducens TaxID=46680 RepID=UPI0020A07991|nr:hypothetical protein [Pseudomonas nitroreducens]MCP1621618.1 hypothetical protein [Pseudomonas nitroreducens]